MNDRESLTSFLYVDQVDPEELAQIALEYFGGAIQESLETVAYHRTDQPPALKFFYSGDRLTTVEAGPGILDTDIANLQEKIKTELLDLSKKIVGRAILFSSSPVTGYLTVGSYFRICPVPDHAAKPKEQWNGGFPFLIEFEMHESPNHMVRVNRISSMAKKISLFLNAVTKESISSNASSSRFRWVLKDNAGPVYEYLQEGYGYSDFLPWQDSFTESETMNPIDLVDAQEYFTKPSSWLFRPFHLPDIFQQLSNIYFQLNKSAQDKFTRAAYWFSLVQDQQSSSAQFLYLIQCIETLLPKTESGQVCPKCNRDIGPGPTARFVDFLNNMVPGHPELAKGRKRLYKIRSDLSHGWELFTRDLRTVMNPKSSDQLLRTHAAYQLARLALINWLIKQSPQLEPSADDSTVVPLT
ncbi:MAG: hypothetical protein IPP12_21065 [Nitrospira sp.]|nr:hypothetical protein [Nitrospira sp.]